MANKQYGLIIKKKPEKKQVSRVSIFGDDSDDESTAPKEKVRGPYNVGRQAENVRSVAKRQAQLDMEAALAQDPTVFDYDGIYDNMQEERRVNDKKAKENKDSKPKYIGALIKAAEKRQREYERRVERQAQKERVAEGDQFSDKEQFVTASFKKKLQELAAAEEEEKRQDAIEAKLDVTKQHDLTGFYRHMLRVQTVDDSASAVKKEKDDNNEAAASSTSQTLDDRNRRSTSRDRKKRSTSRDRKRRSTSRDRKRRSTSRDRKRRSTSRDRKRRSTSSDRKRRSTSRDRKRRSTSSDRKRRSTSRDRGARSASRSPSRVATLVEGDAAADGAEAAKAQAALRNLRRMRAEVSEPPEGASSRAAVPQAAPPPQDAPRVPEAPPTEQEGEQTPQMNMKEVVKLARRRPMEELLAEAAKHSKHTAGDHLSDARARFLARKRQRVVVVVDEDDD